MSEYFKKVLEIKEDEIKNKELSLDLEKRSMQQKQDRLKTLQLVNLNREISGLKYLESFEEYQKLDEEYDFIIDAEIDESLNIIKELIKLGV